VLPSPKENPLTEFLSTLPDGPVTDARKLANLLAAEWDTFPGSEGAAMKDSKLYRMENVVWKTPCLTFTIERHGATCCGSSRAELQDWRVDISTWTAGFDSKRYRQLTPPAKRLDVTPIAEKTADEIVSARESEALKRYPDGRVKVLIGSLIGGSNAQTITDRRKRFRTALEALLSAKGWKTIGVNTYGLSAPSD
jgi:hypothetical protein